MAILNNTDKLCVTEVSKKYKNHTVLNKVSFSVKDGEFLSILGPSGCGKTTLLRILIGLIDCDGGTIYKDMQDITNTPPDKRGMGIVFQNYALFENMSVRQNVEYALKIHKKTNYKEKASNMLELVGMADFRDRMPKNLSGGQQQRVAIARTLALNPDIVLFDEPMSALDVATRLSMREELKMLQERFGTTMIYVTHDQEEAFDLSDRIMIMSNGIANQIDTPREIINNPADDYVKSFVVDNLRVKINSLTKYMKGE